MYLYNFIHVAHVFFFVCIIIMISSFLFLYYIYYHPMFSFLYDIILIGYFYLDITINTLLLIFNKKLNDYVDCIISRN